MTRVWWSRSPAPGNLGDVLTPVILNGLGIDAEWAPQPRADVLCIGSIVRFAQPRHTVVGSGLMWATDTVCPYSRYVAVRGPMTRLAVLRAGGDCPEVYGDPALLLPEVHSPPVEKRKDLGIVPHYVDVADVMAQHPGAHVISPLSADPLSVVDRIRECHSILSSSLHGIIVAHAYGIPAAWVRFSDRLDGDDIKFRDYADSVGVDLVPYRNVREAAPVLGSWDSGPLLNAMEVLG